MGVVLIHRDLGVSRLLAILGHLVGARGFLEGNLTVKRCVVVGVSRIAWNALALVGLDIGVLVLLRMVS